jgi:hypothetical protein
MRNPISSFLHGISFALIGYGLLVLFGHILEIRALYAPMPSSIGMAPTTAFLFILCGLGFWIQASKPD